MCEKSSSFSITQMSTSKGVICSLSVSSCRMRKSEESTSGSKCTPAPAPLELAPPSGFGAPPGRRLSCRWPSRTTDVHAAIASCASPEKMDASTHL